MTIIQLLSGREIVVAMPYEEVVALVMGNSQYEFVALEFDMVSTDLRGNTVEQRGLIVLEHIAAIVRGDQ